MSSDKINYTTPRLVMMDIELEGPVAVSACNVEGFTLATGIW